KQPGDECYHAQSRAAFASCKYFPLSRTVTSSKSQDKRNPNSSKLGGGDRIRVVVSSRPGPAWRYISGRRRRRIYSMSWTPVGFLPQARFVVYFSISATRGIARYRRCLASSEFH